MQTRDGYLLGLHRLGWKRGEEGTKVNSGNDCIRKRVVYLHHGLLMSSEVWVCLTDEERNLPFTLVERGYDVWVSYYYQIATSNLLLTIRLAGKQSGQQILEKVHYSYFDIIRFLGLFNG